MPRKLTDKREFPAGSAHEALALTRMLAESLLPLALRLVAKEDGNWGLLNGHIKGGTLSVETGVKSIDPDILRDLYDEANAEAVQATSIYVGFMMHIQPVITITWYGYHGGVSVDVDTYDIGWGHEVLEMAERVVKAGRPIGVPGSAPAPTPINAPASAPVPTSAATAPSSPPEALVKQRKIPLWAKWVGGVATGLLITVLGGAILSALGFV